MQRMSLLVMVVMASTVLSGCSPESDDTSAPVAKSDSIGAVGPMVSEVTTIYSSYRKMTPEPVVVNMELSLLCRPLWPGEREAVTAKHGPHAMTTILVYMNEQAAQAFESGSSMYPPGSSIVKEKMPAGPVTGGIGGMIKRTAGYDPPNGDWEYFYLDDAHPVESGRMQTCISCHRGAKATDYVFGDWRGMESYNQWATRAERRRNSVMPADFDEYRMGHLVRTAEVWKQWVEHGVTETTKLDVEFSFVANSQQNATALKTALSDYELKVNQDSDAGYLVQGSSGPIEWNEEQLLNWVDYLIALGSDHGCKLGGIGASIP